MVKEGIRIIGFDDGYLNDEVLVIGVVWKLKNEFEGVISFKVKRDGRDSTEKIIKSIRKSRFYKTTNVIMTNGISFGGFNIFDIQEIYEKTGIPVIIVITKRPNFEKIRSALMKFEDFEERWKMIEKAGPVKEVKIRNSKIYFQHYGISENEAREIIKKSCIHSKIPEPVRLAHLIASGVCLGESTKKI